jgi:hypothetical protein
MLPVLLSKYAPIGTWAGETSSSNREDGTFSARDMIGKDKREDVEVAGKLV